MQKHDNLTVCNKVFNVKRINGLTLIETMVAIMLLSLMILGTISYFTQRAETMRAKQLGNDMALIMNAIDKKLQLDAYSSKSWKSSSWGSTDAVMKGLIGEELRTSNSSCGKPNGWVSELAPDPLALVPCDRLSGDFLPSGVQVSASYATESAADGGRNISIFTINYGFKDADSFKKNFGTLVKAQKALDKFESAKNLTVHSYNYFNATNKAPMTLDQCLASAQGCGLRTQIEAFVGLSTDKVRIDGKNDLMGEIDFDNADTKCTQWDYVGGLWKSKEIKCTVQGGFDSKVGSVDAFINNTTIAERISLKDQCELTGTVSDANGEWLEPASANKTAVPCGLTKDGSRVVAGFDKSNSKIVVADYSFTRNARLNTPEIKYNANLYGGLLTDDLAIQKSLNQTSSNITDKTHVDNNFKSILTEITSGTSIVKNYARVNILLTTGLRVIDALLLNNTSSDIFTMKAPELGETFTRGTTSVIGQTLIDTRDPKYKVTNGGIYQRGFTHAAGNVQAGDFYSGYSTSNPANKLADQSWNTLKINNISGKSPISIIGSSKDSETIKEEMKNPAATDLDVAIYKDAKTFYSDPESILKAKRISSDGVPFTSSTPPNPTDFTGASIYADAGFADSKTVIRGKMQVSYNGSPRVTVDNNGLMTIRGKNLGNGNTTADFMLGWPATAEGSIWENGFRNKVFRSSLVTIVKGETRIYGNVWQWKPLHVKASYQAYDVCDRPGGVVTTCLTWGWNELNTIQVILQNVQAQFDKVESKFPIKIGDKGDNGEQGFKGEKGQDGDTGPIGERGPRGPMEYLKVN
jgi:type II secretory pathway pseudopilin PulG